MYDAIVPFPKMKVAVRTREERVAEISYLPQSVAMRTPTSALASRAARQLEQYREDPNTRFDLPRGKTLTYGELARRLGVDARAVGQACGDNRLPIVIPCHRVVAADGIGGFAHATGGYLLEAKRWLLAHECGADAFELTP